MKITLLEKLACPFDKHDLQVKIYKQEGDTIQEGILTCSHCQRYYPIIYSVPIMSPDEYRERSLEQPLLKRWGLQLREDNSIGDFRLLEERVGKMY